MTTHWDVAHNWAHQTGKATDGFAMKYRGDCLYSWQTVVARLVSPAHGPGTVVLISKNHWGYSSGSHIRKAIDATSHLPQFRVETPDPDKHEQNYQGYMTDIRELLAKSSRAQKYTRYPIQSAEERLVEANQYSRVFLLSHGDKTLAQVDPNFPAILARSERLNAKRDCEDRLADIATKRRNREVIRQWLAGETVRPPHTLRPMVRVVGDKVETSWGVTVPLSVALLMYRTAQIARQTKTPLEQPNIAQWGTGHVDAMGTIHVGCHTIPFRYAQCAARLAGLDGDVRQVDAPPSTMLDTA